MNLAGGDQREWTGIQGGRHRMGHFPANDVVERSSYARGNFGRWGSR